MRFLFLFVLMCLPAAVRGGEAAEAPKARVSVAPADTAAGAAGAVVDPALAFVFSRVDSAWRSEEAAFLAPCIGRRGLGLSLAGGSAGDGWFSRNQALSVLDQLLRSSETVRFDFVRYRNLGGEGGRPNAAAIWERRRSRDALVRQVVFLSFAREEGKWVIAEVKTKDEGAASFEDSRGADR